MPDPVTDVANRDTRSEAGRRSDRVALQPRVHERHHRRALAGRGRNPLHRARADVTSGEDARQRRREVGWRQPVGPPLLGDVATGQDEAVVVEQHRPGQPSTTRVEPRTVTRGFHSISLMRYDDIVAVRSGRRTTMVTLLAKRAAWIAACPAELPPPTTTTWSPPSTAGVSPVAGQPVKKRVPNRSAWPRARCARRMPEMPRGKPR